MKRIIMLLALACITVQASAGVIPKFKLGVKAGLDYQSNKLSSASDLRFEASTGWFAGVQGDLSWKNFGIHPEILYSRNTFDIAGDMGNIKLNKLDIPVLLQYRFWNIFALQAGPTFCVMTNTSGRMASVDWELQRPTMGYALGAEARIWKLNISARYNGSFNRSEVLGFTTGKNKIDTFQLGVGVYF